NPLAVGRPLRIADRCTAEADHFAVGYSARLTARDGILVKLLVRAGIKESLAVGRPGELAFLGVAVGNHLLLAAMLVAQPDLVTAALVTDERNPLAVGRPLRQAFACRGRLT